MACLNDVIDQETSCVYYEVEASWQHTTLYLLFLCTCDGLLSPTLAPLGFHLLRIEALPWALFSKAFMQKKKKKPQNYPLQLSKYPVDFFLKYEHLTKTEEIITHLLSIC